MLSKFLPAMFITIHHRICILFSLPNSGSFTCLSLRRRWILTHSLNTFFTRYSSWTWAILDMNFFGMTWAFPCLSIAATNKFSIVISSWWCLTICPCKVWLKWYTWYIAGNVKRNVMIWWSISLCWNFSLSGREQKNASFKMRFSNILKTQVAINP